MVLHNLVAPYFPLTTRSRTLSVGGIQSSRYALISPMLVRSSRRSVFPNFLPRTRTVPFVGHLYPLIMLIMLVLPAPLGPINAQLSPLPTFQLTSTSAVLPSYSSETLSRAMTELLRKFWLSLHESSL